MLQNATKINSMLHTNDSGDGLWRLPGPWIIDNTNLKIRYQVCFRSCKLRLSPVQSALHSNGLLQSGGNDPIFGCN